MADEFEPGKDSDADEVLAGEKHIKPTNLGKSVQAPEGSWVDVPKGMIAAPGTYVDEEGYLRHSSNDAYAVWHRGGCPIIHVGKEEIVFDIMTGAPWCPVCHNTMASLRIEKLFSKPQNL